MTDHVRGDGPVELEMFGDFECPYCRDAVPAVEAVLAQMAGRVRVRFRHFPLAERHPHAVHAARAAEAAAKQDTFWPMHDTLFAHQSSLEDAALAEYARELGLDVERFRADFADATIAAAVQADVDDGIDRDVRGTPAFFIDGEAYQGFYDAESLGDALEDAGT